MLANARSNRGIIICRHHAHNGCHASHAAVRTSNTNQRNDPPRRGTSKTWKEHALQERPKESLQENVHKSHKLRRKAAGTKGQSQVARAHREVRGAEAYNIKVPTSPTRSRIQLWPMSIHLGWRECFPGAMPLSCPSLKRRRNVPFRNGKTPDVSPGSTSIDIVTCVCHHLGLHVSTHQNRRNSSPTRSRLELFSDSGHLS